VNWNKKEKTYDYDFLSKPLREKSKWNKHKGKYSEEFILYVDAEYRKLQQKRDDILYLSEHLEKELVDVDYEISRIQNGEWWFV
jgi:hypothetical protein